MTRRTSLTLIAAGSTLVGAWMVGWGALGVWSEVPLPVSTPATAGGLLAGLAAIAGGVWLLVCTIRRSRPHRPARAAARDAQFGRDELPQVPLRGGRVRHDPARRARPGRRASVLPPAAGRVTHSSSDAPTLPPARRGDAGGRWAGQHAPVPPNSGWSAHSYPVAAPYHGDGAATFYSVPSSPGVVAGGHAGRTFRVGRVPMDSLPSRRRGVPPGGKVAAATAVLRGAAPAAATTLTPGYGGTVQFAPQPERVGLVDGTAAVARSSTPARPGRRAGRVYASVPTTRPRVPTEALAAYYPLVAAGAPQMLARTAEANSTARFQIDT